MPSRHVDWVVLLVALVAAMTAGCTGSSDTRGMTNVGRNPSATPREPPTATTLATAPELENQEAAPSNSTPVRRQEPKPALAIAPFDVLGEVSVEDAGSIIAEWLLPHLAEHYRIVDQTQLKQFLVQDNLTMSDLVSSAQGKKALTGAVRLRQVRFLVVGSISGLPGGKLSVTARVVDWQTGSVEAGRVAELAADTWHDLRQHLPSFAAVLAGDERARRIASEGLVERRGDDLIVTVSATGKDELERLQKVRQRSRRAFAEYVTANVSGQFGLQHLLEFARDNEKLLDAQDENSTLRYVVRFPIPKTR